MIYEIVFKSKITTDILISIGEIGGYCFSKNVIYIETDFDKSGIVDLYPSKISEINEINNSNYNNICIDFVKNWCKKKIIVQELLKFEQSDECQEKLNKVDDYISHLENYKNELNKKGRGCKIAKKKN